VGNSQKYALGVDYGTNSVRALIVGLEDGSEAGKAVCGYPSGESGVLLDPHDPHLARQEPNDYLIGFKQVVRQAVEMAKSQGIKPEDIVGIGVDTTGSTPLPIDANGTPLASLPQFADNLAAKAWLWKDHTSVAEAEEITQKAKHFPYLAKCGGEYSSEWFWSKILHCARTAPEVFDAAHQWVELADFVPAVITGTQASPFRGSCAAGHKAMFHPEWGGLPSRSFLDHLDPRLGDLRERMTYEVKPSDQRVGGLTAEYAEATGLIEGTPVAVGAFDAHMGAVGAGVQPGILVKIMGTSTCDILVGGAETPDIPGVCGVVPDSVIPGLIGVEAGQSAVGDLFNWCTKSLAPHLGDEAHRILTQEAEKLKPGESGLLALDWNNGNRTILVDARLTGLILGQTLHTSAAEIYRALIEATAFGALMIINRIEEHGVKIEQVVNCGGIAEKSPFVMQIYADITDREMKVSDSDQTCALGAAIFGAIVGGVYSSVEEGQAKLVKTKALTYKPNPEAVVTYRRLFHLYQDLHDAFGGVKEHAILHHVMKELLNIQAEVRP
jgi:L-ribulokinase